MSLLHDKPDTSQEVATHSLLCNALASLVSHDDQQKPGLFQRSPQGFFSQHGLQQLQLAHLQPVRDVLLEQYQLQGYHFADVSSCLKAPMSVSDTAALRAHLTQGCAQDAAHIEALAELAAALRDAEQCHRRLSCTAASDHYVAMYSRAHADHLRQTVAQ